MTPRQEVEQVLDNLSGEQRLSFIEEMKRQVALRTAKGKHQVTVFDLVRYANYRIINHALDALDEIDE